MSETRPNTPLSSCPLCRTDLSQGGYATLSGFEKDFLVRCGKCGFTFSLLDPTAEDYARVYGAYDYVAEDDLRTDLNIEKEREIVRRLLPYKRTGRVLDVAAGAGRFLARFQDQGFECHATEFSPEMCAYLEKKGFVTHAGGLYPAEAPREAFDIIVFTEIIEHINTPIPVLENLRQLLRPGGCIYVTTPNFASLERRILGPGWGMLMWPEHITYWTPRHLHRALRRCGFRKASLVTQNISPYRIVQALKKGRLASVVSGVSEQQFSDSAQKRVAGSRILGSLKAVVNAGLRTTGLGSSIVAVYENPA